MATLDDKLMGEKLHYYCSSSEDEGGESENEGASGQASSSAPLAVTQSTGDWDGGSSNTGPKGVLKDWQRYKQLETEKREEAQLEKLALAQKLSLTCRSTNDDEKAAKKEADIDKELEELLDDDFLETYMQKRMQEMMSERSQHVKKFGQVINLYTGDSFLDNVDQEDKRVTVIVMIYEPNVDGCAAMNGSIECLASEYTNVKFCKILSTAAGLSKHFKASGVPALLIYKAGQLMGSFVRMTDEFGEDFFANDVESFLIQHGMLPNKEDIPSIIRGPAIGGDDDSDVSLE